jgi:hypothetical protein
MLSKAETLDSKIALGSIARPKRQALDSRIVLDSMIGLDSIARPKLKLWTP